LREWDVTLSSLLASTNIPLILFLSPSELLSFFHGHLSPNEMHLAFISQGRKKKSHEKKNRCWHRDAWEKHLRNMFLFEGLTVGFQRCFQMLSVVPPWRLFLCFLFFCNQLWLCAARHFAHRMQTVELPGGWLCFARRKDGSRALVNEPHVQIFSAAPGLQLKAAITLASSLLAGNDEDSSSDR
jgi:hypothetical protein